MGEYEKALPLLIQGSEAGFIPVNVMIGDCYWNGYGVTVDTTTAIQYYLLAAELGDAGGLMRMGHVYLQCNEPEKAVECYTKAYDKGIDDALFNLAVIYYTGYEAIERISDYTNRSLSAIDKQTREIIRYEEMSCVAYRNEAALAKQRGIDRVDIANKIVMQIMQDHNAMSDSRLQIFLDFIDNMTKPFISFQDYARLEGKMGRKQ